MKTLRIDLAAGRWCEDDCKETVPIVGMDETVLMLEQSETAGAPISDSHTYINRETGQYNRRWRLGSFDNLMVTMEVGPCKRLPFSGFPAKLF